jgi:hypothetical protein
MEWDRGNSKKKDQKRSQEDKEMAADHIISLGGSWVWDERFPMPPPCGLRVGGYWIEWTYEKGINSGFERLFGGVCLRPVGHA